MTIQAALLILALVLLLARKPIARAAKRYARRKRAQLAKYLSAQFKAAWIATKVSIARRTVGLA
jgi:hypothetical protein